MSKKTSKSLFKQIVGLTILLVLDLWYFHTSFDISGRPIYSSKWSLFYAKGGGME